MAHLSKLGVAAEIKAPHQQTDKRQKTANQVLHPAVRIAFFKGEQWDPSVAVRVRQLLLEIVKRYAQADRDISPTKVDAGASPKPSTITARNSIFAMAMALKATPALPKVTAAVDGKDEVELYCGNISPVAPDFDDPLFDDPLFDDPLFDDPLKWWKENSGPLKYMEGASRGIFTPFLVSASLLSVSSRA
ncbi:hypothetical protein B0H19DRAFT_1081453 [Mycena capillaripes]|nr:hypothetical protein B0H19DRAFT_1081453 [Mycena capillaripes]